MPRVAALAAALLLSAGCGGSGSVDDAVRDELGSEAGDVSCKRHHAITIEGESASVFRCIASSGEMAGETICVVYGGERLYSNDELEGLPVKDLVCDGQA